MTNPTENERALAQSLLQAALNDLRLESARVGRTDLFEALSPALLDPSRLEAVRLESGLSAQEIRLAIARLRERLRERVNAGLRRVEPDAERRRALRRRLQSLLTESGTS